MGEHKATHNRRQYMNAKQIIETIRADYPSATNADIREALCDGETLKYLGVTDADIEAVEEAMELLG